MSERLWGIKIWDDTGQYYYTEIDVEQSLQHIVPTEQKDGYNTKYPFITHNGVASYYQGSGAGNFSDNKSGECYRDYNFDYNIDENGNYIYNTKYLNGFVKWLHNKRLKYLQFSEQLVIPVSILQEVNWDNDKTVDDGHNCKITFNWVQQGDEFSLDETSYESYCPACGEMIAPTAKFCRMCGKAVYE